MSAEKREKEREKPFAKSASCGKNTLELQNNKKQEQ